LIQQSRQIFHKIRSAKARAFGLADGVTQYPGRCRLLAGAALTNVRSWESNGLNANIAFGPFMTPHKRHPANPLIADRGDVARWAKVIWDAGIKRIE